MRWTGRGRVLQFSIPQVYFMALLMNYVYDEAYLAYKYLTFDTDVVDSVLVSCLLRHLASSLSMSSLSIYSLAPQLDDIVLDVAVLLLLIVLSVVSSFTALCKISFPSSAERD